MATLPEIIGALVSDAFQLTGIPGGSVAEAAIRRYFRRRAAQARDILFEERIASPANVPETSSVASPSVLPLPHCPAAEP